MARYTSKAMKEGAAVMRGPMASNTMHQLIAFTDWGYLDYLIIDMPPGTSDIHLTLGQEVSMDGAVIVTTPQKLAYVDVVKGIDMFDSLRVPILGLVQNMAYFDCGCGKRHMPFGPGHGKRLIELYGIPVEVSVPIQQQVSEQGDMGQPYVVASEGTEIAQVYNTLAEGVVKEVAKIGEGGRDIPLVDFDSAAKSITVTPARGDAKKVSPSKLREECRCAGCQNEKRKVSSKRLAPEDVMPTDMSPKGRYALNIEWSDGHSSIYTYQQIEEAAE